MLKGGDELIILSCFVIKADLMGSRRRERFAKRVLRKWRTELPDMCALLRLPSMTVT